MNSNKSIQQNYLLIPLLVVLYFIAKILLKPKDAETTAAQISDNALKKDAQTLEEKAESFNYARLPKKTRSAYLGIANSMYEKLNEMTWVDRDTPYLRHRIIQSAIDILKSYPTSVNSKFNADELYALYINFGVRTVNCGFTDYTGNFQYFLNLWGSSEQIAEYKHLTRHFKNY